MVVVVGGAAGRLWNGESEEVVASYVADIEANHMGLGQAACMAASDQRTMKFTRSSRKEGPLREFSGAAQG